MTDQTTRPTELPEKADGVARRRSVGARRSADSAAAILDAAEALLEDKGLGGFSIEAVARAARAGKPTIYRWWPNKTSLVLAVYQRQKRSLPEIDTGALTGDCLAFLEGLEGYWRDTSAGAVFSSLIAEAQTDREAAEVLRAYFDERHRITANLFRRAQARGEMRADVDPVLAAEMLASYARGHLLIGRLATPRSELEQAVRQLVEGLLVTSR